MDNAAEPTSNHLGMPGPKSMERARFMGFVRDAESAAVLNAAFGRVFSQGSAIRVVDFPTTLHTLARMVTPEVILIDVTGQDQPLNALMSLAEVVDSTTKVLVIGEERRLSFYRSVVNMMGVAEYIAKPLTSDTVARHLLHYVEPNRPAPETRRAGRMVAVTGVRGGVGTTTIAANLAWIIGQELNRHALLLDTDMHTGTAAFVVNAGASSGLAEALDTPGRIDEMLVERVAIRAGHRFFMIASPGTLDPSSEYTPGSGKYLARQLENKYNFVISDCGSRRLPFAQEMMALSQQRVVILDPSLMAIRNLERLSELLTGGAFETPHPILVLNQAGVPNGLRHGFMEEKLGRKFDVIIPNLRQTVPDAENHGHMAASVKGPFHDGIRKLADLLTNAPGKTQGAGETKAIPAPGRGFGTPQPRLSA